MPLVALGSKTDYSRLQIQIQIQTTLVKKNISALIFILKVRMVKAMMEW